MILGTWTLGDEIGRGPHGTLYRATNPEGTPAAVKLLSHPAARDPAFQKRFAAELLAVRRLSHPTIARTFDAGVTGGSCWYAREWVDGTDLATLLKARERTPEAPGLPWADAGVKLFALLTRGLIHAHHRSLLHRGLYPGNVILTPDGGLKLTDFGLAKLLPTPSLELLPDPWGAAGFLAPEGFAGRPLTKRSDLYALGAVAYTLVAGRPPFQAATAADFLHKHTYTLPERPALFAPDLPTDLDDLICALLAKDPTRRPTAAGLVLEALGQVRDRQVRKGRMVAWPADVGEASEPMAALPAVAPPTDRPLMSRPAVVVPLFLVVAGLIGWLLFRPGPDVEAALVNARPLLASNDPTAWERAWVDHLEPLGEVSGPHAEELAAARQLITRLREMRRAVHEPIRGTWADRSDAERWYLLGLRLAQAGDVVGAKRVWTDLRAGFVSQPDAEPWTRLAQAGLLELTDTTPQPFNGKMLVNAVERLKTLPPDEAARQRAALEDLYRDDPAALALIRR